MGCETSSIENGRCTKSQIIGRRIHMWGLVALPSPQKLQNKFEICKDENGELSDIRAIQRHSGEMIFPSRLRSQVEDSLQEYNSYSIAEAGLGAKRKERREGVRDVHTRTEGRQTFPLRWEVYNLSHNDASEAEVITDAKKLRKQIKNPQIICRDDLQEARMAHIVLTQLERVHAKASSKIKRLGRSVSQRRMPRETEKPPLTMIDEKPTGGTSTSKKNQDGHGMMKSENF